MRAGFLLSGRQKKQNRQLMTSLSHDVRTPVLQRLLGILTLHIKELLQEKTGTTISIQPARKAHDLKEYIDVLLTGSN